MATTQDKQSLATRKTALLQQIAKAKNTISTVGKEMRRAEKEVQEINEALLSQ